MNRLAITLLGALTVAGGLRTVPARADEPTVSRAYHARPVHRHRAAYRPRRVAREVVVRRVYRPRRVIREVIVERPVYVRRRVVVREFVGPYGYGPPPFAFGPPPFRPRFAYGPGFYGPGFYGPFRPVGFGFGYGPRFGYGPFL